MKANFIDINNIFFSNTEKNCNVPDFSIYLASCRVQTRAEIAQNSEVFASKLEDATPAAIFFRTQPKLHCSSVLCAKPCGKRILLSPEKSSEETLYSVPTFGGHIAISHDVTVYPFLVMARTALKSHLSEYQEKI